MSSTLGIIIGNRDFFPDHLITEARNEVLNIFKNKGLKPIILKDEDRPTASGKPTYPNPKTAIFLSFFT